MPSYPKPSNEASRLRALRSLEIYHSEQSAEFDAITQLASKLLGCRIALISLVEENEQWFKSNVGLDVGSTSRDVAFCAHTITQREPLIVADARLDERFSKNPLVLGQPNIVFYAGVPISIDDEHQLGTLCAIDDKPRQLSDDQLDQLRNLARVAESLIVAFRDRKRAELARKVEAGKNGCLERSMTLLEQVKELSGVGGWELQLHPLTLTWTDETKRIHEVPSDYVPQLDTAINFYAPEAKAIIQGHVDEAIRSGTPWDTQLPLITAKNRKIWVRAMGRPVYHEGKVLSVVGAFQDITAQTEAHEKVRASEESARLQAHQLQTVIDNMEEGVSVFDSNARLTSWNQRYIDTFRKPNGEVHMGIALEDLLALEQERGEFDGDIGQHQKDLLAELAEGNSRTFFFRTKDGIVIQSKHAPLPGGGWVGTHTDVTDQVKAAELDEYAARHDTLTGLTSRLEFNRRMEDAAKGACNGEAKIVLLVDLDRFKGINDVYGHQKGDDLLKEVAKRLKASVRDDDTVARIGGDEFAVLTECKHSIAKMYAIGLAKRINRNISRPFEIAEQQEAIGASVGICVADGPRFAPDELIRRADRALYKAKSLGRGGFYFHDDSLVAEETARQRLEAEVRSAVSNASLALAFQPFFDLRNLECRGAEALIRWVGETPRELFPNQLIAVAETTGAIGEIGAWVLHESIRIASTWPVDQVVSVNVSPSQLGRGVFRDQVCRALETHRMSAERLEIEITEQVLLNDEAIVIDELLEIKARGVRIVLDDFGTGFASLSYLRKFPFDKLKIDRSFVVEQAQDSASRAIISSIVTLAEELGMTCTAEGVESHKKLTEIQDLGCDFAQGYHLARPTMAEDFLAKHHPRLNVA